MRERPIIMSGPMVRSIMRPGDPKTETRRVINPQPVVDPHRPPGWTEDSVQWHSKGPLQRIGFDCGYVHTNDRAARRIMQQCSPYGQEGDRLWVRETYSMQERLMGLVPVPIYAADEEEVAVNRRADGSMPWAWTPAIHMRREHSRLTLEVLCVFVERLHEITRAGALAEGLDSARAFDGEPVLYKDYFMGGHAKVCEWFSDPVDSYRSLWDSINEKRSHAWKTNPWVWVVRFKLVERKTF